MSLDIERLIEEYTDKLDHLQTLIDHKEELDERGKSFATSLIDNFTVGGSLSYKQWEWVYKLAEQAKGIEPIYGSFNPILVMFRIAGSNDNGASLKLPKIRLMTKDDIYVQLNFDPKDTNTIKIYRDGWAGHGYRKFAGQIKDNMILPYTDRMTDSMKLLLQELALDPLKTAKAMASKLNICMYCGQRLADKKSKDLGYGKTCAKNWGLKY